MTKKSTTKNSKTKTKAKTKTKNTSELSKKLKNIPKKYKIIGIVASVAVIAAITLCVVLNMPVSRSEAAEIFSGMLDRYNTTLTDMQNDVKVLDVSKLREDAKKMISVVDENVLLATETKWPENLGKKEKRLSGETKSDMDIYTEDLKKVKEFCQNMINASDEEILSMYEKDQPYAIADTDNFRSRLGLPSAAADKNKYHTYTEDEITEKLQETAVDITLGKFSIDCKTEYGYTSCASSMDTAVRNKSSINFTSGGSIDVTAYDQSNNPIDTATIYIGNRLEKGQTTKQKIFTYISDEHRTEFQHDPTFKVTKVQIYNY